MDAARQIIAALDAASRQEVRRLVAISGPPASGKSFLAREVVERLVRRGGKAVLVPMDGFHLDNSILAARGLLDRKGAPETFDAAGFLAAIARLKQGGEVVLPSFDRDRDLAIAGSIAVDAGAEVVVVEGNYLCLAEPPWQAMMPLWDLSVRLEVPRETLRARLVRRWLDQGLSAAAAELRADGNDLRNGDRIASGALPVDLVLHHADP